MSYKNICWFTIGNSPGTSGNFTVSTAVDGLHVTLGAADDGLSFDARIFESGVGSEVRTGCTYTHGTTTLSRGTLESSTSGSALNFTSAAQVQLLGQTAVSAGASTLVNATGSDANTSMQVGKLYVVDMSSWATADRTYTLPAVAAVGERVGVAVSAGSASYELLVTAASGDTLNGVAGGTEWSRVFITGEVVIFRCVVANSTWIVEYDGRIPCRMEHTSTVTATSSYTNYSVSFTGATDPQSLTSGTTLTVRRAGYYRFEFRVSNAEFEITTNYPAFMRAHAANSVGSTWGRLELLAADTAKTFTFQRAGSTAACGTSVSVQEVL